MLVTKQLMIAVDFHSKITRKSVFCDAAFMLIEASIKFTTGGKRSVQNNNNNNNNNFNV